MNRSQSKSKKKPLTPHSKHSSSKPKETPSNKPSLSKSTTKPLPSRTFPSKTPKKLTYPQTPPKTGDKPISSRSLRKTPQPNIKKEDLPSISRSNRKSPRLSSIKKEQSQSKPNIPPSEKKYVPSNTKTKTNKKTPQKQSRFERSRSKSKEKLKSSKKSPETKIKKESNTEIKNKENSTEDKGSIKKEKKTVIITAKKIKEEPLNEDINENNLTESKDNKTVKTASAATSGFKSKTPAHHFSYDADPKGISQEIENILKKIEKRKQSRSKDTKVLGKKVKREHQPTLPKKTAKDYNYELQSNPNIHIKHYIDFKTLSTKPLISNTELALSFLEIGEHYSYYVINFSNRSKMFWEDILEYKTLHHIFKEYKGETLRKYWRMICKYDIDKVADIINKHKTFLDNTPIKLRTILTAISYLFENKIEDIETYIKNIQFDIRKQEIFQHEYTDPQTGEVTTVKDVRTTIRKRNRYEPGYKRQFNGKNISEDVIQELNEIYGEGDKQTQYQNVIKQLNEEDFSKLKYLSQLNEEEKRKLMQINEDDKFLFKVIDNVVEELLKQFKQYSREYIFEMLCANSMNIGRTYLALTDNKDKEKFTFSTFDDNVILNMKDSEQYKELLNIKGEKLVNERYQYLNH